MLADKNAPNEEVWRQVTRRFLLVYFLQKIVYLSPVPFNTYIFFVVGWVGGGGGGGRAAKMLIEPRPYLLVMDALNQWNLFPFLFLFSPFDMQVDVTILYIITSIF